MGERDCGCVSGVAGGVRSCLIGGDIEIVISRFSEGRKVGVVGVSVEAIEADLDESGIIELYEEYVSMCPSTARR